MGLKETETVQVHVMFMVLYPKNYFKLVMSVLSCLCLPFFNFFIGDFSNLSKFLRFSFDQNIGL